MSDCIEIRFSREKDNLDSIFKISKILEDIDKRRRQYNINAKYKIGQYVRVVDDVDKLTEYFKTVHTNYHHALIQARSLAGRVLKVLYSEELVSDDTGEKGVYINLEDNSGYFYLLSEDLVKDLGAI